MRSLTMVAAAMVLTLSAGAAMAQPDQSTQDRAREMFMIGARAFEAGEYDAAIEAFQISYDLNPVPTVLYNIAMCHRALLRFVESLNTFDRYLAEGGSSVPPERRREVTALIDEMEGYVGHLRLIGVPEGATITIDGDVYELPQNNTIRLRQGSYALRVTAPDQHDFELDAISVGLTSATEIEVTMEPIQTVPEVPVYRRWWFWTIIGGAVALTGAGIGLGVGLSQDYDIGQGNWDLELP